MLKLPKFEKEMTFFKHLLPKPSGGTCSGRFSSTKNVIRYIKGFDRGPCFMKTGERKKSALPQGGFCLFWS